GIFCNERTRSTPLDPKLMFWSFFYYLGAFGTIWLPYKTRCKTGQNWCKSSCQEVASEFFETKAPDPPPLDPKLIFWCVSYYLGAFGTLWLPYNTQCKTGQTGAKVRATKSRWNFSNEHPRSTPLDPKLMFWCVLYYLVHLGTVWLRNNTYCKMGQTG